MVFMPPRHGKSELVSRLFPAYCLYRFPERWTAISSYAADLAYTLSRNARENYTRMGGAISGDASAVKHWETGVGGGLWACGVGGPATGKGFHFGLLDDPIKNAEEAASETIRAKHRDWWASTWYTRCEPDAALVVVQTRWDEGDLSGHLLNQEGEDEPERWHIVSFEAIKESEPPAFPSTCTLEPDPREVGDPLCPERYPLARLKAIAKRIGQRFFAALFQQRPAPADGVIFKRHYFEGKFVDDSPHDVSKRVRYWDLAGSENETAAETAGVLIARAKDGRRFVEDVISGHWSLAERKAQMLATAIRDRRNYPNCEPTIWFERPIGQGGKEMTTDIVRHLDGFSVHADSAILDKVTRAEPFASQCEVGNVWLVKGEWNEPYIEQLAAFPHGRLKDKVDASSGANNKLMRKSLDDYDI